MGDYNAQLKRLAQSCDKYEQANREYEAHLLEGTAYAVALQKASFDAAHEVQDSAAAMKIEYDGLIQDPNLTKFYRRGAYIESRRRLEYFGLFADYTYFDKI